MRARSGEGGMGAAGGATEPPGWRVSNKSGSYTKAGKGGLGGRRCSPLGLGDLTWSEGERKPGSGEKRQKTRQLAILMRSRVAVRLSKAQDGPPPDSRPGAVPLEAQNRSVRGVGVWEKDARARTESRESVVPLVG